MWEFSASPIATPPLCEMAPNTFALAVTVGTMSVIAEGEVNIQCYVLAEHNTMALQPGLYLSFHYTFVYKYMFAGQTLP